MKYLMRRAIQGDEAAKKVFAEKGILVPKVSEDGRIHLSVLCDGTFVFLVELIVALQFYGCTDIEYSSEEVAIEDAPEGKPWCRCRFKARGVFTAKEGEENG